MCAYVYVCSRVCARTCTGRVAPDLCVHVRGLVAQVLLQYGADIDQVDATGRTPLLAAVAAGQVDVARSLLAKGAPVALFRFLRRMLHTRVVLYMMLRDALPGGSAESIHRCEKVSQRVNTWYFPV